MMGNRGYAGGAECDAFSRRSRRLLNWQRGDLRKLKRAFAKRTRRRAKALADMARTDQEAGLI